MAAHHKSSVAGTFAVALLLGASVTTTIIFLVLRGTNEVTWPLWWVLSPLWITIIFLVASGAVLLWLTQ